MLSKMKRVSLLLVFILTVGFCIPNMELIVQAAYTPYAPKTSATASIKVFDLTKDLSYKSWAAKEAYMICTVIQGIVNRTSADKIYFTHSPQEHDFAPAPADQYALDDGMIPVPRTTPTLDNTKTYPVLSYLLTNYASYIKGKVLIPDLSSPNADKDAAIMAAITACGIEDAIPVSTAMNTYIAAEGFTYTTKADTRSLGTAKNAFDWAYNNYFRANTSRQVIGHHSYSAFGGGVNNQFGILYDYFVANRVFVICSSDDYVLDKLLTSTNYTAGTPVFGLPLDEAVMAKLIDRGYPFDICNVPNVSVTSSFPYNPSNVAQAAPAVTPSEINSNDAYVAFYVTDGDSMGFSSNFHYNLWRNSPERGKVPIGWSYNLFMNDLFPTMTEWRSNNNYNDKYELIADTCHVDVPKSTGYTRYTQYTKDSLLNSKDQFKIINVCEFISVPEKANFINDVNPDLFIDHYANVNGGNKVYFGNTGSNRVLTTNMSGGTQDAGRDPTNVANEIRAGVNSYRSGEPAFVLVCIGDGRGSGDCVSNVNAAVNQILANPQGRNYHFVRPRDMVAAKKFYDQSQNYNYTLLEDFNSVSDWGVGANATVSAANGVAAVRLSNTGFGNISKSVTCDVDNSLKLEVSVPELSTGAKWALKVNDGSGDIKLMEDSTNKGIFYFDLKAYTGWSGKKTFNINLYIIGNTGYEAKLDYISLYTRSVVNLEDYNKVSDWNQTWCASISATDGLGKITCGNNIYGYVRRTVTLDVDTFSKLSIKVPSVSAGAMWSLKVNDGTGDKVFQADTSSTGEFVYDLKAATGWSGVKNFDIVSYVIGGSGKSYDIDYIDAKIPDLLEDFDDVSDWNTNRWNATIGTTGGVGSITCSNIGYGYVAKSVAYDVTSKPKLTINVSEVGEGGKWSLKANDGSGDIVLQADSSSTGTFTYDLKSITGWSSVKTYDLTLYVIGATGSYIKVDYIKSGT